MLDKIKISIPFKDDFIIRTTDFRSIGSVDYVDIEECSRRGMGLEAKSVHVTGDSSYDISDLRHPYETLPTHFTGMACKIFQGTPNRAPCLE